MCKVGCVCFVIHIYGKKAVRVIKQISGDFFFAFLGFVGNVFDGPELIIQVAVEHAVHIHEKKQRAGVDGKADAVHGYGIDAGGIQYVQPDGTETYKGVFYFVNKGFAGSPLKLSLSLQRKKKQNQYCG